jgi:hypothetical protein
MFRTSRITRTALVSALTSLMAILTHVPALAQGMYLKEIERDGRIYVFNIAERAERFESTGEMPDAITMTGVGPNGETVIGDSEKALQLYFFRHNLAVAVPETPTPAPAPPPWRISGLVFGDYYWFAKNHSSQWQDQNGLWLRRAYFTFDYTFSPAITTRLRLEMNSNGKLAGGSLTPYVKDAYLRWTYYGRQQLMLGIQPSLTFTYLESAWGLRHIEKTPLDLYRWDSSRDTGVSFSGPLNQSRSLTYAAQFGNESGNGSEVDTRKAVRGTLRYDTDPGFTVEVMAGHFNRANDADRTTAQIFVAYGAERGRVGFQYSFQKRRPARPVPPGLSDINLDLFSGYAVYDIKPKKMSAFARVDRVADPCRDCAALDYLPIDPGTPFTMTLLGMEFYAHPSVRFSPNVEIVAYDTPGVGAKPKNDVVARFTFYWVW